MEFTLSTSHHRHARIINRMPAAHPDIRLRNGVPRCVYHISSTWLSNPIVQPNVLSAIQLCNRTVSTLASCATGQSENY